MLAWWSGRDAGDQRRLSHGLTPPAPVPPGLRVRRLRQVHGRAVVEVGPEGDHRPVAAAGHGTDDPEGDALVTGDPGQVLAVLTADCAPVALASPRGRYAAVHVGWRGLMAGVTAAAVEALGPGPVVAGIGPTIGPCCYEFLPDDLDSVVAAFGERVGARSTSGRPSLDLPGAVRVALEAAGALLVVDGARCTACAGDLFSYRARGDDARQALFVWREGPVREGPVPAGGR